MSALHQVALYGLAMVGAAFVAVVSIVVFADVSEWIDARRELKRSQKSPLPLSVQLPLDL